MIRNSVPGSRIRSVLAFFGSLAAAGCAATPAPIAMPPDAAAIHAAERARGEFEGHRPLVRDPELAARISEIGLEAIAEAPLLAAGAREETTLHDGWRFLVLDDAKPEAFLFADRTIFVSRGALAALPGEPALVELFGSAAATFASGTFRSPSAGDLVEQPLPLVLPLEPDPERPTDEAAAPDTSRDRWFDLLDGLLFGEPAEFGVADGSGLLLPQADFRLSLPDENSFEPVGRGVFRASRKGEPLRLTVREIPVGQGLTQPSATGFDAAGGGFDAAAGGFDAAAGGFDAAAGGVAAAGVAAHRAHLAALAAHLRRTADCHGAEATFVEAFRVRGFSAVRSRVQPLANEGPRERAGKNPATAAGSCGGAPSLPADAASGTHAGEPAGLLALFRSKASLVEVSLDCARRRFDACEALFLEVLGSADRLWDTPVPGPLRITALAVGGSGSARDALDRLAAEGRIDGPPGAVEFLNRGWLDDQLGSGDRLLILSRSGQEAAPEAGGRDP